MNLPHGTGPNESDSVVKRVTVGIRPKVGERHVLQHLSKRAATAIQTSRKYWRHLRIPEFRGACRHAGH